MEIEMDVVSFGELLKKFRENNLSLVLVPDPDEPGAFKLVAKPL